MEVYAGQAGAITFPPSNHLHGVITLARDEADCRYSNLVAESETKSELIRAAKKVIDANTGLIS